MMDPDGDFTPNSIDLYYYEEPTVSEVSSAFAFADEEKVIVMAADFNWGAGNQLDVFRKHANVTCRFTSENDYSIQKITPAIIEMSPIGQFD